MPQQKTVQSPGAGSFDRDTLWRLLVSAAGFGLAALSIWAGQP